MILFSIIMASSTNFLTVPRRMTNRSAFRYFQTSSEIIRLTVRYEELEADSAST
jgi:hypothetical protein